MNLKAMLNKKAVLAFALVAITIALSVLAVSGIEESREEKAMKDLVDKKINEWAEDIKDISEDNDNSFIMVSSNPYDYLNTKKFKEIKELGPEYLPYIVASIEKGNKLFAWGMQDITKVKFEDWSTSGEWLDKWNIHLKNVPEKFNKIRDEINKSDDKELIKKKNEELAELGVPVIPFILEEIESGNIKMSGALKQLLQEDNSLPAEGELDKWSKWSKENKSKYSRIKYMVKNAK